MLATLTVGKRLIPLEQIALLEPFDPSSQSSIKSERAFQSRIVLLNRDSILSEESLDALTSQCGFRAVKEESISFNPSVLYSVEAFEAAGDFKPTKPYRTRLLWRDQTGFAQSKLLLIAPEEAIASIVRGGGPEAKDKPLKPKMTARKSRARSAAPSAP